jgi:O-methyltransferase
MSCYNLIKNNTLVDIYRCYELWELSRQLDSVEGNYLEVGVWRGGTGCLLAKSIRNRAKRVYLADTFEGVVKTGQYDTAYRGGEHADTSEDTVLDLARTLSVDNISILKGVFPEETGALVQDRISLLHCDVDVYTSAKDIMEWVIPRLSLAGVIVFDDYGFSGCEGITRLVRESRLDKRFLFVHNLNGHAILVRRS